MSSLSEKKPRKALEKGHDEEAAMSWLYRGNVKWWLSKLGVCWMVQSAEYKQYHLVKCMSICAFARAPGKSRK